jgi:hypothetical protein
MARAQRAAAAAAGRAVGKAAEWAVAWEKKWLMARAQRTAAAAGVVGTETKAVRTLAKASEAVSTLCHHKPHKNNDNSAEDCANPPQYSNTCYWFPLPYRSRYIRTREYVYVDANDAKTC